MGVEVEKVVYKEITHMEQQTEVEKTTLGCQTDKIEEPKKVVVPEKVVPKMVVQDVVPEVKP